MDKSVKVFRTSSKLMAYSLMLLGFLAFDNICEDGDVIYLFNEEDKIYVVTKNADGLYLPVEVLISDAIKDIEQGEIGRYTIRLDRFWKVDQLWIMNLRKHVGSKKKSS